MPSYRGGSLMDVTGRMPGLAFEFDKPQLDKLHKKLDKLHGKPLGEVLRKQTLYAADLLVPKIKAAAPVLKQSDYPGGHYIEGSRYSGGRRSRVGMLRRSVRARTAKKRFGFTLVPTYGALVGPTAPHRHLVIRGTTTRTVYSKQGKELASFGTGRAGHGVVRFPFSGGRVTPNPFVDRASKGYEKKAADIVKRAWLGEFR